MKKKLISCILVSTMAVSLLAGCGSSKKRKVPLFRMYSKFGLLNSAVGFMLPSLATPLLIMMSRTNAKAFPVDIIEAARTNRLSEFGIFFRMYIPSMKAIFSLNFSGTGI